MTAREGETGGRSRAKSRSGREPLPDRPTDRPTELPAGQKTFLTVACPSPLRRRRRSILIATGREIPERALSPLLIRPSVPPSAVTRSDLATGEQPSSRPTNHQRAERRATR